ncbi:hypothetical protein [Franconibacter helveticus]|uniref:hypothetical protein n=1 Tax=Franconibacter helveticus TaxID=357240 RepID=UPI00290F490D|nr:hypothetical protein [Franconibacter helveticus]MDU6925262.1 hypothetical protein [Franconibacter helveticus]
MGAIYKTGKYMPIKFINLLAVTGALLISGCQNNKSLPPEQAAQETETPAQTAQSAPLPTPQMTSAQAEESQASEGSATICQRELAALSKINPSVYAVKKQAFETLLQTATSYSAVRSDINEQTRDTLDALYKYKTQKICNDIEQAIQQGLISRGESIK